MTQHAVAGTRRSYKELVDGTLRVQVDIDPKDKARFLELFPQIDMPMAVAPLVLDFEGRKPEPAASAHKLGSIAHSAVMLCKEPSFQRFAVDQQGHSSELPTDEGAADYIRAWCRVASRKDLDTADGARERFGDLMARYREWRASR